MTRFLIWWLKQLFCVHDWEAQGDILGVDYVPRFKCSKCGKEEGL